MKIENSPHLIIPDPVLLDMIYGEDNGDDLKNFLSEGEAKEAKEFLSKPADYWITLMQETFARPKVTLLQ